MPASILLVLLVGLTGPAHQALATFLPQLPLKPLTATPAALLNRDKTTVLEMWGRQPITVVFSRPVIALGSDFGKKRDFKRPFSLTCGVPGRFRWVTTTIARWDPDVDWPTDLDCTFQWDMELTSWDGIRLQLKGLPSTCKLSSLPQQMNLASVRSDRALNLTDSLWDAWTGMPDDKLPEVPPDGVLDITFTYPVNLKMLSKALVLHKTNVTTPSNMSITVSACEDRPTNASLDVNANCARIRLGGKLEDNTSYQLRLPKGSKYHALAGPSTRESNIDIHGLRLFRIPFRQELMNPYSSEQLMYRRLSIWLPHGLATNVSSAHLEPAIDLCELSVAKDNTTTCTNVNFTLTRPSKGMVVMHVPQLAPQKSYRAVVSANDTIKDGYNLTLMKSNTDFKTQPVAPFFRQSETWYGSTIVTLESFLNPTGTWWPILSYGEPEVLNQQPPRIPTWAGAWSLDTSSDKFSEQVALLSQSPYWGWNMLYVPDMLGEPQTRVNRSDAQEALAKLLYLPLRAGKTSSTVHVVHTCCTDIQTNSGAAKKISSEVRVVLRTQIAAAAIQTPGAITAWVTSAVIKSNARPVLGAEVFMHLVQGRYIGRGSDMAVSAPLLGKCTTGASGTCVLPLPKGKEMEDGGQLVIVARKGTDVAVLNSLGWWSSNSGDAWDSVTGGLTGTLVLDRALVRPGDTLHVTGYLRQRSNTSATVLPYTVTDAALSISPGWTASGPSVNIPVKVDPEHGSVHAAIDVPLDAMVLATDNQMRGVSLVVNFAKPNTTQPAVGGGGGIKGRRLLMTMPEEEMPGHGGGVVEQLPPLPDRLEVAMDSFVVADPRPPTAELELKLPLWAKPGANVTVEVQATSYIGAQIGGAEMTLRWSTQWSDFTWIQRSVLIRKGSVPPRGSPVSPTTSGLVELVTDTSGSATAVIDLSKLPEEQRVYAGQALNVEVEWIGPTRERLVKSGSVAIEAASRTVTLDRSWSTDIVDMQFGVLAAVKPSGGGQALANVSVVIQLRPNDTNANLADSCATGSVVRNCTVSSVPDGPQADRSFKLCQLSLPCMGHFVLEACTMDADEKACTRVELGRNETEWKALPWSGYEDTPPRLDIPSGGYVVGASAKIRLQVPWPTGTASALLAWGGRGDMGAAGPRTKLFPALQKGFIELNFTVGEECVGGCSAALMVTVPRLGPGELALPAIPTSKLFDPRAPHSHAYFLSLFAQESKDLAVKVSFAQQPPVLPPGASTSVNVEVKTEAGEAVDGAEVTIIAVDKAVLDLMPYRLRNVSGELQPAGQYVINGALGSASRVAPNAIDAVFKTLLRRLQLDPWISLDTQVSPPTGAPWDPFYTPLAHPVDQTDEEFFARFVTSLTYMPSTASYCNGRMCWSSENERPGGGIYGGQPPSDTPRDDRDKNKAGKGGNAVDAAAQPSTRLQGNFKATPLFVVARTASDGSGSAKFVAPANLGTFVVRAYAAHGKLGRYGAGEAEIIVRRKVSLTPSLPRFVRLGDKFQAGVVVTLGGGAALEGATPFNVTVRIRVQPPTGKMPQAVTLPSFTKKTVKLSAAQQQVEVRFPFRAKALGTAQLLFSATPSDDRANGDSVQLRLDVHPQQGGVFVGTSFAIKASNGSTTAWQEGMDLPEAVPGSGALDLVAGVGHLPGVLALLGSQAQADSVPHRPSAYPALALALVPSVAATYAQPVSSLPPGLAGNATQALEDLLVLTDPEYGLKSCLLDSGMWGVWTPRRADVSLNAMGAWLLAQGDVPSDSPFNSAWGKVALTSSSVWRQIAEAQLVQDALEARASTPPYPYSDFHSMAWVRLASGAGWKVPDCNTSQVVTLRGETICASPEVAQDLSWSRLLKHAADDKLPMHTTLLVALAAQQAKGSTEASFVHTTLKRTMSGVRVQGRTAYISSEAVGVYSTDCSSSGCQRSPAPREEQAFALLLAQRAKGAVFADPNATTAAKAEALAWQPFLEKLAAYLASSSTGGDGMWQLTMPVGPTAVAGSVLALADYDVRAGSAKPDLGLTAIVGGKRGVEVLKATFSRTNNQIVSTSTPWEELPSPPGALDFSAKGTGEASIAASLQFVPAQLLSFPSYRGLWVQAAVQALNAKSGLPEGPPLGTVPLGSVVGVTLQVTSPDELGAVTVVALMPGGLEPVDPAVAQDSGARTTCSLEDAAPRGGMWGFWWPWPLCPAQVTLPSSVTFQYLRFMAGTSVIQFKAVAATAGTFVMPPVRASADLQPELMGMTAGSYFVVCDPKADKACGPTSAAPATSKGCPGGSKCSGNGSCNLATGACICSKGWAGDDCSVTTKA